MTKKPTVLDRIKRALIDRFLSDDPRGVAGGINRTEDIFIGDISHYDGTAGFDEGLPGFVQRDNDDIDKGLV